ncbi:MAG: mannonate dehydratase [Hyphomicrobiales bacterium]
MLQTWRWFGPQDTVSIDELLQVGVEGVVSALHHLKPGTVWSVDEVKKRQQSIATRGDGTPSGIAWEVVESLPVSEAIKTQTGDYREHIQNYKESMRNLAACDLKTICYNFMPILDWTRTDLRARMPHGGPAMGFDLLEFAVFDLFILRRSGAGEEYPEDFVARAQERFDCMDEAARFKLQQNIVAGLPGANDNWGIDDIRQLLATYASTTADQLRARLIDFLSEIMPLAQELGMRLCCHPDDPPFTLLGLPRVMSCEEDYVRVLNAIDVENNGITLCTGSLGVTRDFDAVGFVERLGSRIHFAHLRNTTLTEPEIPGRSSFYEAAHLEGGTDMVSVVAALLRQESKRKAAGRADWQIPMRPDHGQDLLHDLKVESMPGYPLIGRMRGLAELRGIMAAVNTLDK